jgi:hypothetical protein
MPVGNNLKLNFYAIGVEDEQFGRIAAPRYLGIADTEVGKISHNAVGIEILNRQAVREKTGLRAACTSSEAKPGR